MCQTPNWHIFHPIDQPYYVWTIWNIFSHGLQSELDNINQSIHWILYRWSRILFKSAKPRIGTYSTRLTSQIMSEPFKIIFAWFTVTMRQYWPNYSLNIVQMVQNIIVMCQTPNRHLFHPIDQPDYVRTIPDNFWMIESFNSRFTCWIMSEWTQILFQSVILRVGCYSTRLTPQIMSEPFMIIFESLKIRFGWCTPDLHAK